MVRWWVRCMALSTSNCRPSAKSQETFTIARSKFSSARWFRAGLCTRKKRPHRRAWPLAHQRQLIDFLAVDPIFAGADNLDVLFQKQELCNECGKRHAPSIDLHRCGSCKSERPYR